MDAANIIKPALARGELCCIGATTITEYRRYIEADPALERRFEKIIINEPSLDETVEILKGLRPKLEEHHHVRISDQALQAAVDLSVRFDGDHQLPDKAIDLVDKAGARTRVPLLSMRPGSKATDDSKVAIGEVTEITIAQVLSEKIGVPLEIITGHLDGMKKSRLLELEAFLKSRIIGQDDAVQRVCQRLLMAQTGLVERRGPLAVFSVPRSLRSRQDGTGAVARHVPFRKRNGHDPAGYVRVHGRIQCIQTDWFAARLYRPRGRRTIDRSIADKALLSCPA